MRIFTIFPVLLLSQLALLGGAHATATGGDRALGRDGYSYELRSDTFGGLAGVGVAGDEGGVLGLILTSPAGSRGLHIVPTTEGSAWERTPRLVYVESMDAAFLLWESTTSGIHSDLHLTSFTRRNGFSDILTLGSNSYGQKLDPHFLVTRDEIGIASEERVDSERTFVHLVWSEASGAVLYSPVVLSGDGLEPASTEPLRLDTLFGEGNSVPTLGLEPRVDLGLGVDSRSAVVGFLDPVGGRVSAVSLRLVPSSISRLADGARDAVLAGFSPDLAGIASAARAHIIHIGRVLNPVPVVALGAAAEQFVLESGATSSYDLPTLADAARAHIIHIGARLDREGLGRAHDRRPSRFLELATSTSDASSRSHDLELRFTFEHHLPGGESPPQRVIWSQDGSAVVLVWTGTDRVTYRVSEGDSWSARRELAYGPGRTLEDVLALIAQIVGR